MSGSVAVAPATPPRATRRVWTSEDYVQLAALAAVGAFLVLFLLVPLWALLSKSFEDKSGAFVGLGNFARYFGTPALFQSVLNSLFIASISTVITVALAFVYAYGLTRSRMPGKGVFTAIALVPLLAPSLLPAISLVYLFGNQGMIKAWLMGHKLYGPIGIIMGEVFYCFPHALMILVTAMSTADARLYEAAESLRARRARVFLTVTLPGMKYGLIGAVFVTFTLAITDFGVPKVVGGNYNVLAIDIYKQVIGQQNFQMGAVVGVILLIPAVLAFAVDRLVARKQVALLSARAVPYEPKAQPGRDALFFLICAAIAAALLTIIGVAAFASHVKLWPYNLSLGFTNYDFDNMDGGGWGAYRNSVVMSLWTALIGTIVVFIGAYLVEKVPGHRPVREAIHLLAILPLAVPGLVLGLGYIFFFNEPANPLNIFYRTMAILALCTVVHFYSVCHLTAVTALKQIDSEFESV
ncbi:MAG: putative 2-aminoethylphosphonate ABC transporter permease subunit, partial [Alphaproteobacteria bacterium]|nr:putative 2-aminoethylphosphonate ABC transporter permease subunit [Alphaproteobacteria bacterium]